MRLIEEWGLDPKVAHPYTKIGEGPNPHPQQNNIQIDTFKKSCHGMNVQFFPETTIKLVLL